MQPTLIFRDKASPILLNSKQIFLCFDFKVSKLHGKSPQKYWQGQRVDLYSWTFENMIVSYGNNISPSFTWIVVKYYDTNDIPFTECNLNVICSISFLNLLYIRIFLHWIGPLIHWTQFIGTNTDPPGLQPEFSNTYLKMLRISV